MEVVGAGVLKAQEGGCCQLLGHPVDELLELPLQSGVPSA